jgi:hypothetical protein
MAATDLNVAGRSSANPRAGDAFADSGDGAAPLVSKPHGIGRDSVVEIRHFAGVELDVSATHPDAFNVDDHLARPGDWWRDVLDRSNSWGGDHQRSHDLSFDRLWSLYRCRP